MEYSLGNHHSCRKDFGNAVLILILMEYSLGTILLVCRLVFFCLNPYSNGILTWTYDVAQ